MIDSVKKKVLKKISKIFFYRTTFPFYFCLSFKLFRIQERWSTRRYRRVDGECIFENASHPTYAPLTSHSFNIWGAGSLLGADIITRWHVTCLSPVMSISHLSLPPTSLCCFLLISVFLPESYFFFGKQISSSVVHMERSILCRWKAKKKGGSHPPGEETGGWKRSQDERDVFNWKKYVLPCGLLPSCSFLDFLP